MFRTRSLVGGQDAVAIIRKLGNSMQMEDLSCDIVIDAFDSSYWRVYSKYPDIIERINETFKDTEAIAR